MKITAVTTFHYEGMLTYGQRLIDSWQQKVDPNIILIVYAEDCQPETNGTNVEVVDAKVMLPKLNDFKMKWGAVPKANGKCPHPEKRPRDHHKEFKWDAVRFANKVYAVFDACETEDTDYVVWVDGDTFVHSEWSYENFARLLPQESWITYVGRGQGSQTWPECGFYGLNIKDKQCRKFLEDFEEAYEDAEGPNGIFKLTEWHDSYVFGEILNKHKNYNPRVLDYSASIYVKTAKTGGGGHPLINTELGRYIDHMKGARKHDGHSKRKDLMDHRKEAYWNEI